MKKLVKKSSMESDYLSKHRLSTGDANIPTYQELEQAAFNNHPSSTAPQLSNPATHLKSEVSSDDKKSNHNKSEEKLSPVKPEVKKEEERENERISEIKKEENMKIVPVGK